MRSFNKYSWYWSLGTALSLVLLQADPCIAMKNDACDTDLEKQQVERSKRMTLVDLNSSYLLPAIRAHGKASRQDVAAYESSFLHHQQAILKDAILKAVEAEPDVFKEAQVILKGEPFADLLKHPAELLKIRDNDTIDFSLLDDVINDLQRDVALSEFSHLKQQLRNYYCNVKQMLLQSDMLEVLESKVRLTGDHLSAYLIPQKTAQELSWRDLYGYQPSKGSQFGNHRVLGKKGVHFKLSPGGHTEEGGMNELRPGMEYALSSFYQLLHQDIAPPSTLLVLQERTLHQLPPAHPFTKGLQLLIMSGKVTAEEFFSRNPDVKEALKNEMQVYKHPSILQASLTKGSESLLEFLMRAQQDPSIYESVNLPSFSALIIASLLTNPADGKPDNFRVSYEGNKATFISIDNDESFVSPVVLNSQGAYENRIKNVLYLMQPLMKKSIDKEFKASFLKKSPEVLLLEWIEALKGQNDRYKSLVNEKSLSGRALEHLSLPIRFAPHLLTNLYEKLLRVQDILKNSSQITHADLLKKIDPVVSSYYNSLLTISQDDLLKTIASVDPSRTVFYEELFQERPKGPLLLNSLLYGQKPLIPLTYEMLCNLEQTVDDKSNTLKTLLKSFNNKTSSSETFTDYLAETEDLDQAWLELARKTAVGEHLSKRAKETRDAFLAGKLLALGVGNIRDIIPAVASLDSRITELDLSYKDIADKQAQELASVLNKNASLEAINLKGNKITSEGFQYLALSTQRIHTLILGGNPLELKNLSSFKYLTHIETLDLSQTSITDADILKFFQADAFPLLKHLNVSRNPLTSEAGRILLKYFDHLLTLDLSRTGAALGALEALATNNHLQTVNLSHCRLKDADMVLLKTSMSSNTALKHLNLSFNTITDMGARDLADIFTVNNTLQSIDLSKNGLQDQGLQELSKGLARNTSLETLNLNRNFISDKGVLALYKTLQNHPSLSGLYLDYNKNIGEDIREKLKKLKEIKPQLNISLRRMYES